MILPALGAWFLMLLLSVANGAVRDFTYGRRMGELRAHQISTAAGMVILGAVIAAFVSLWPPASGQEALLLGGFWTTLTIAFEFLFFHFVGGHTWAELRANYDLRHGRVWVLLLLWIALAPLLFYHLR